jgi:hypothetical protein
MPYHSFMIFDHVIVLLITLTNITNFNWPLVHKRNIQNEKIYIKTHSDVLAALPELLVVVERATLHKDFPIIIFSILIHAGKDQRVARMRNPLRVRPLQSGGILAPRLPK